MSYDQIIERLYKASVLSGNKTGLDNALDLDQRLGHPASLYPTIHIAGSNGKGSVATKIAKALELSNYRVGLYTSPHLFSFRERIAVNSTFISEEDVVEILTKLFAIEDTSKLTFFELTTFLAFEYFRKAAVDVAVIETGLGGRLDATNVIQPILSVITSISCEHTSTLGSEIEQIAAQKAGIIKENIPVILGPKARFQSIYDRAKQMNSPVFVSKKISHFFDEENNGIAQLTLNHLDSYFDIQPVAILDALLVRPPCRFERIGDVIFDVAHNPEAIFCLLQALHSFFPNGKFRFLVGFSKDKEYDRCLELIADVATHIHLVQADSPRAATIEEMKAALTNEDPRLLSSSPSLAQAVTEAQSEAHCRGELLVISGSFYIMAEAKNTLQLSTLGLNEKIFPAAFSSLSN